MAQALNNFLASKMNKDKDARLIPPGEYREGRNINISKSEGADEGALENVLGNIDISSALINELESEVAVGSILEVIGLFKHDETSSLYLFFTTYSDASSDKLSNNGIKFGCFNYICKVTLAEDVYSYTILAKGSWLNFSTTHPIIGFNIIENILFWSDNRNQPRKLNIETAEANPANGTTPWYYKEDQISVATYAPVDPILLVKNTGTDWVSSNADFEPTSKDETSEYLPIHLTAPFTGPVGNGAPSTPWGLLFETDATDAAKPRWIGRGASATAPNSIKNYAGKVGANDYPQIRLVNLDQPNQGSCLIYETGDSTTGNSVYASDPNDITTILNPSGGLYQQLGWDFGDLIGFQLKNPDYNPIMKTNENYLKDKFVRFSYRFKYLDNEYSLMAPFTQPVFIPGQWGNLNYLDEEQTAASTELQFFENLLTSAELNIILPEVEGVLPYALPTIKDLPRAFNLKEIEILVKFSNDNNIYSIDSLEITSDNIDSFLEKTTTSGATFRNEYPLYSQFIYKYKATKPFRLLPERDVIRVSDSTPIRSLSQEVGANRIMYGNYLNKHAAPSSLNYQCLVSAKNSDYTPANNPPISKANNTTVKEYYNNTLKQGRTYQVGVVLADRYGRQSSVILASNSSVGGLSSADNSTVVAPYSNTGSLNTLADWFGNSLKVLFNSEIPSNLNIPHYPGLYSITNPLGWYSYKIVVKQQQQEYYNVYLAGSLSGNVIFTDEDTELSYTGVYSTSNLSLFGDNINKIPRALTNVGPTDKIYGSDTGLYFRVYQPTLDVYDKFNSLQFPDPTRFNVSTIQPWYDFAPWSNQKGKAVAYPGGVTAASTKGTIDPIFNADRNPFIATVDHSSKKGFRLGFAENVQANAALSKFSTNLIVAETQPVESQLDIFWETSTSGLISDLNASIAAGANANAPKSLSTFNFIMEEKYAYNGIAAAPGKYLLDPDITIIDQSGNVTSDVNYTIELNGVASILPNGSSVIMSGFFEIEKITATTPHTYNIKLTTSPQYYNLNEPNNPWNGEFLFEFELTTFDNSATPPVPYPPLVVNVRNNLMTNNIPEWTSTKNWNSITIPTPEPVSQEQWCISVTGKKDPLKQFPMWNNDRDDNGRKFWYIDISGVGLRDASFLTQASGTSSPATTPYFGYNVDFANGSYGDIATGCRPIIKKIEFATYNNNNDQIYPSSGFEELKINQTNPENNSGYPFGQNGYNSKIESEYPIIFTEDWNGKPVKGWRMTINKDCPPWVPVGYNNKYFFNTINRFWPEGDLDGNDYCIYKISAVVQEDFPLAVASRFETPINEKIFYLRLNR